MKRDSIGAGDYLFAFLLIIAGVTGFASEFASELNATGIIYSHLCISSAVLRGTFGYGSVHEVHSCNWAPTSAPFRELYGHIDLYSTNATSPVSSTEGRCQGMNPDWALDHCITCYMCLAACPVYKKHPSLFLGPVGFVKLGNMHFNPVDKADRVQMAAQGGVQLCESYGACQEVCPQHIRIVPLLHLFQDQTAKRDLRDNRGLRAKSIHEMTNGFI